MSSPAAQADGFLAKTASQQAVADEGHFIDGPFDRFDDLQQRDLGWRLAQAKSAAAASLALDEARAGQALEDLSQVFDGNPGVLGDLLGARLHHVRVSRQRRSAVPAVAIAMSVSSAVA